MKVTISMISGRSVLLVANVTESVKFMKECCENDTSTYLQVWCLHEGNCKHHETCCEGYIGLAKHHHISNVLCLMCICQRLQWWYQNLRGCVTLFVSYFVEVLFEVTKWSTSYFLCNVIEFHVIWLTRGYIKFFIFSYHINCIM